MRYVIPKISTEQLPITVVHDQFAGGYDNGAVDGTTVLKTVSLPVLGANDAVRITTLWSFPNTATAKSVIVKHEGEFLLNETVASAGLTMNHQVVSYNANSQSVQKSYSSFREGVYEKSTAALEAGAVDTSVATDITFSVTTGSSETVVLEAYSVEVLRP